MQDAQRALKLIRANAAKWKIAPEKVGIMGTSAGGHLAAITSAFTEDMAKISDSLDAVSVRPDFAILVSPVIDMGKYTHAVSRKNLLGENPSTALMEKYSAQLQVTVSTPPAFIVHAADDKSVDPNNSLVFYQALLEKKIISSLHIFPQGGHAIALRNNPGSANDWTRLCETWLQEMNFLSTTIGK